MKRFAREWLWLIVCIAVLVPYFVREAWLDRARVEARSVIVTIDGKRYRVTPPEWSDRTALAALTEAEVRTKIQSDRAQGIKEAPASSRWVGALGLSVLYGTGLYLLIGLLRVTVWSLRTVRR